MPEDLNQANLFGLSPEPKASETITVSYERKIKGHSRRETFFLIVTFEVYFKP